MKIQAYSSLRCLLVVILMCCTTLVKAKVNSDTTKLVTLTINIENYVGQQKLRLADQLYLNGQGQDFTLTTFNYFISNISLTDAGGKRFVVPQEDSYFLVKANDAASKSIRVQVPPGTYRSIDFVLGVDSLRNTMEVSRRKGALDPAGGMIDGMYWSWNSGYIFFKMEGQSETAPLDKTGQHKFRFHIGGFGGYNKPSLNNIKTVTIDFNRQELSVLAQKENLIGLKADVLKVFNGATPLDLSKNSNVMFGSFSALVAENYKSMFSLVSIDGHEF